MLKKLCLLSVLSLAALAAASHILAIGSHGSGTATTQDGRNGSFHFSVVKRTAHGHQPAFEGSLRLEQHHSKHAPWILVEMGRPSVVSGVKGGVCEFSGPGSLTRLVQGHQQTVHGTVTARVVDRRDPHHTPHNPADLIRVSFVDNHSQTFMFDGTVHSGDLVVFSRQEH